MEDEQGVFRLKKQTDDNISIVKKLIGRSTVRRITNLTFIDLRATFDMIEKDVGSVEKPNGSRRRKKTNTSSD